MIGTALGWLLETIGSQLPWWIWGLIGLGAIGAVWHFLGFRAALAMAAAVLPLIGYRKGRDDQRTASQFEIGRRATQSQERIDDEARIARERGRAAADRVRRASSGPP